RRIDIVIDDGSVFIPIEVKIYAGEQDAQLADYAAFSRKMNAGAAFVPVLFLTPDGRESAETPREDYAPIAFDKHIIPWLEKCLEFEETKNALPIREVMKQLVRAIKSFCGRIEEESMENAINALISESSDSYAAASAISKAYNELDFDGKAWDIFKGAIFFLIKIYVPDAEYCETDDWWYFSIPVDNGLVLSVNYDWKKFAVEAADPEKEIHADLAEKIRKAMSGILGVRNEDDDSVWWSESGRYPGIDIEEDDLYKFELYQVYSENPPVVADRIASMVTALKNI
ncbi:MAG: PD-(D/E)XK nuclease family protein, partial [Treponema sp.]|nr:PD-(D/E)XK nuclease family protein [Treponema sp.]